MSKRFLPIFAISLQALQRKEDEDLNNYHKRLFCILKRVIGDDPLNDGRIESSDHIGALICNVKSEGSNWAQEFIGITEKSPPSALLDIMLEFLQQRQKKRCVVVEGIPLVENISDEMEFVRHLFLPMVRKLHPKL